MKRLIIFSALFLLFSSTCDKLPIDDSLALPLVEIPKVSNIDNQGVTFSTYVHQIGDEPILRSSFNWYPANKTFQIENERYMIDVELKDQQEASVRLDRDLVPNTEYVARLIIELENQKIYTDTINFMSKGSSFSPIGAPISTSFDGLHIFNGLNNDQVLLTTQNRLFPYDPIQGDWIENSFYIFSTPLIRYFQTVNNKMYGIAWYQNEFSQALFQAIWSMSNYELGFDQYIELPSPLPFETTFAFTLNGTTYAPSPDWNLVSLNLDDYQGVTAVTDIPFHNESV